MNTSNQVKLDNIRKAIAKERFALKEYSKEQITKA
jgi:hypothetical protein